MSGALGEEEGPKVMAGAGHAGSPSSPHKRGVRCDPECVGGREESEHIRGRREMMTQPQTENTWPRSSLPGAEPDERARRSRACCVWR